MNLFNKPTTKGRAQYHHHGPANLYYKPGRDLSIYVWGLRCLVWSLELRAYDAGNPRPSLIVLYGQITYNSRSF